MPPSMLIGFLRGIGDFTAHTFQGLSSWNSRGGGRHREKLAFGQVYGMG